MSKKSVTTKATKTVAKKVEAKKEVVLPENLESALGSEINEEMQTKLIQEFVAKQRERSNKRIEARTVQFKAQLKKGQSEANKSLIVKKIMLQRKKAELAAIRKEKAELVAEIKGLRIKVRNEAKQAQTGVKVA